MLIDRAAAAFHAARDAYTVIPTPEGAGAGYCVQEADGTTHVLGGPEGHTEDAAKDLAQILGDRDGVTAMLREMISPAVLINAAHHAGIEFRKIENNKLNLGCRPALALLKGIIVVLEQEAN